MNDQLIQFAKENLKNGLNKLPESNQLLFKRMYSHQNLDLDINTVVDNMQEKDLDWAMEQVRRTLKYQTPNKGE